MNVTIIVPIKNEVKFIKNTINSILNQNITKHNIQIIISDGMSTDGTRGIVKEFQKEHESIILIDNVDQVVPNGFNKALNFAKGDIIIRVDGHSILNPDFVENCVKVLMSTDADCAGGPTKHISKSYMGINIAAAQTSLFGAGGASFRTGVTVGKYVNTLAFGAYKRNVFIENGAYDEELIRNQDEELNYRLINNGGKIWIDPSIKSTYYVRNSMKNLFRQYFQYGFYKVRVIQKIKKLISWRHLIPAVFVTLAISSALMIFFFKQTTPFFILFGTYFTVSLFYTIYESTFRNFKPLILLPFIFLILHFSYGFGFIFGCFYFIKMWSDNYLIDSNFDKKQFIKNNVA
tara:strand:+ start:4583 stop:5623 length:1041 start_codon:yes stop_codon:yes gene_type:complete